MTGLGRTGDPKGVPANCAHTGFLHNDDWELEDGFWVRKKDRRDVSTITIPDGEDWECVICNATGDSEQQTFKEHIDKQH